MATAQVNLAAATVPTPGTASSDEAKSVKLIVLPMRSSVSQGDSIGVGGGRRNAFIAEELKREGYTVRSTWDADAVSFDANVGLEPSLEEIFCRSDAQFTCRTSIRWTLIQGGTKAATYRVTTRASSTGEGGDAMAQALLSQSLKSLLSRDGFRKAIVSSNVGVSSISTANTTTHTLRRCSRDDAPMPKSAKKVISATVMVESGNSIGAGTVISPDGFVLTAAHVLQAGEKVQLQLTDGKKVPAREVRRNAHRDVALLHAPGLKDGTCMPVRKTEAETGEAIYAIGSPLGKELSFSMSRGIVSGTRQLDGVSLLQTDASVNPGNSGGPLVDEKGNFLGVVDFKVVREEVSGLAFAVTAGDALGSMQLSLADETEPRVLEASTMKEAPSAKPQLVVDKDDPPFTTTQRSQYSYGTSTGARTIRTLGFTTASVGLTGVLTTWLLYKAESSMSMTQSEFETIRTWNDVSWVLTFAGAAAVGGSYLIKEDLADSSGKNQPKRHLYATVTPMGVLVGGAL